MIDKCINQLLIQKYPPGAYCTMEELPDFMIVVITAIIVKFRAINWVYHLYWTELITGFGDVHDPNVVISASNTAADVCIMKIIAFLVFIVLFSCKPALQQHDTGITGKMDRNNRIEFKVNGQLVRTSGWNISRLTWSPGEKQWLNITTNMNEDKRTIMANLDGIAPGIYSFTENSGLKTSHADFKPDYR